jgi:hypothetical protein
MTGRMSNKRTDLTILDKKLWEWTGQNKERGWYPNHIAHNLFSKESLINIQRKSETSHWALNAKALHDALAAERDGRVIQTYVRLANPDGSFVAQETSQNVWRRLQNTPTHQGQYGAYWWIDQDFNPHDTINPLESQFPF